MMGIYIFIGTETLLFGGLFLTIAWLRLEHPDQVVAASKAMHWLLAGVNTAVLLTSSAAVAMAADRAKRGGTGAAWWLAAATLLGLGFLVLKVYEYALEYQEGLLPVAASGSALSGPMHRLFMDLYLVATGIHAVHLSVGILLMIGLALGVLFRKLPLPQRAIVVVVCGVYWHFVDVIWILLYPLLYLAR
ncbi:cytochrome c oxidase subunit 3 [Rhizobium binae]|uniref:Cytochrome c oxidase subunit 3 n=2 Tax=Rhizobium binae TaxID=1138190 RepID=A0ABV2MPR2_9HYPH|nr:cytochrome c oxidase subunit 3 [Rhizobium binae]